MASSTPLRRCTLFLSPRTTTSLRGCPRQTLTRAMRSKAREPEEISKSIVRKQRQKEELKEQVDSLRQELASFKPKTQKNMEVELERLSHEVKDLRGLHMPPHDKPTIPSPVDANGKHVGRRWRDVVPSSQLVITRLREPPTAAQNELIRRILNQRLANVLGYPKGTEVVREICYGSKYAAKLRLNQGYPLSGLFEAPELLMDLRPHMELHKSWNADQYRMENNMVELTIYGLDMNGWWDLVKLRDHIAHANNIKLSQAQDWIFMPYKDSNTWRVSFTFYMSEKSGQILKSRPTITIAKKEHEYDLECRQ